MARRKAFVNLFDLLDFDVLKSVMGQFLLADVGQPQLALKISPTDTIEAVCNSCAKVFSNRKALIKTA